MSISRIFDGLKKRGISIKKSFPIGPPPVYIDHRVHEAFHRERLIHVLNNIEEWISTQIDKDFKDVDVSSAQDLRKTICATINMLRKLKN